MVRETPCAAACLGSSRNHALICWSGQSSPKVIISGPSFVAFALGLDRAVFLDWNQEDLADKSMIWLGTVRELEFGIHEPRRATLDVVRRCFEAAGIEFIDGTAGTGRAIKETA